jgi:hypothetical protein
MKRVFFWGAVFLALFLLFFLGLNLFDSRPESGPEAPALPAARMDPGNGFYLVWGFAEPPETDPLSGEYRAQVSELFSAPGRNYLYRSRYGQWLTRLNADFRKNWQGTSLYFPQLPGEDICEYFASRRSEIMERQGRLAVPLRRYRQALLAGSLEDFTPLAWEFPARSALLATYTAKLFAASRALAALEGDWQTAGNDLFAALEAGLRLIASGRTLAVNSLGKTMVELSLRTLGSLLDRRDCPDALARRVLERLAARPLARFGTAAVRTFTWMSFDRSLERVKKDRIVDPFLLKDYFPDPANFYALERFVAISGFRLYGATHAMAAFFLKKNESVAALRSFWEGIGRLEETPRYLWGSGPGRPFRLATALELGPLWWLRNPLGKMMVRSAVPFTWPVLQHYIYRSQGLKARYDLTRLLARARLLAGRAAGLPAGLAPAELEGMLGAVDERDPFSGTPFRFNRERGVLYSIGSDGTDNGGREMLASWRDSDIAVPITFVSGES